MLTIVEAPTFSRLWLRNWTEEGSIAGEVLREMKDEIEKALG